MLAKFNCAQKINEYNSELRHRLKTSTKDSLTNDDLEETEKWLSIYVALDEIEEFEEIFINAITLTACEKLIRPSYLEDLMSKDGNKPALAQMYDQLLDLIDNVNRHWIVNFVAFLPESRPMILRLLIRTILGSVQTNLAIIFSPTSPDSFQHVRLK